MTKQQFKKLRHTYRYYNRYCGKGWEEHQRNSWLLGYVFSQEEIDFMKQVTMWTLLDDKTVGLWRDDVDVDKVEVSIQ